ncbi:Translocon-associated protein subunit delta [Taenia crassiceps]|uniref:Translocon-associated protein subunit delta n=1 Tax=Taenia crassiceps TaxID=6207 RepID=A0ABR4Q1P4_9CEST
MTSELYAVLGEKIVPASRNLETDEFQVTFSDDHKKLPKGYYSIRFYDDMGYLSLRKAQSHGQPLDIVKPVFTVDVYHPSTDPLGNSCSSSCCSYWFWCRSQEKQVLLM